MGQSYRQERKNKRKVWFSRRFLDNSTSQVHLGTQEGRRENEMLPRQQMDNLALLQKLRLADLELATKTNPNLSPCKNAFY